MEAKISYNEASKMSDDEIEEANAALDIYIELLNEKAKEGIKK